MRRGEAGVIVWGCRPGQWRQPWEERGQKEAWEKTARGDLCVCPSRMLTTSWVCRTMRKGDSRDLIPSALSITDINPEGEGTFWEGAGGWGF